VFPLLWSFTDRVFFDIVDRFRPCRRICPRLPIDSDAFLMHLVSWKLPQPYSVQRSTKYEAVASQLVLLPPPLAQQGGCFHRPIFRKLQQGLRSISCAPIGVLRFHGLFFPYSELPAAPPLRDRRVDCLRAHLSQLSHFVSDLLVSVLPHTLYLAPRSLFTAPSALGFFDGWRSWLGFLGLYFNLLFLFTASRIWPGAG